VGEGIRVKKVAIRNPSVEEEEREEECNDESRSKRERDRV
jgi:hypothetical protein